MYVCLARIYAVSKLTSLTTFIYTGVRKDTVVWLVIIVVVHSIVNLFGSICAVEYTGRRRIRCLNVKYFKLFK